MSIRMVFVPPHRRHIRECAQRISDTVANIQVSLPESESELIAALSDAEAAYGTLSPQLLSHCRRLRWLQAPAANPPPGFFFSELVAHPVTVTNLRGIFNDHVATHAVAFVLGLSRGFQVYSRRHANQEWSAEPPSHGVVHLAGATALIVGLGGIGTHTARLLHNFGMEILAVDVRTSSPPPTVTSLGGPEDLDEFLPRADFVILTVPHTPETERMLDGRRFDLMKSSAYLVNVGRGMLVDTDELVSALEDGRIAGCALDVVDPEPLPAGHPLWTTPNTILTPHVAVYGPYLEEREIELVVENVTRFAEGRDLVNVVDKARWF